MARELHRSVSKSVYQNSTKGFWSVISKSFLRLSQHTTNTKKPLVFFEFEIGYKTTADNGDKKETRYNLSNNKQLSERSNRSNIPISYSSKSNHTKIECLDWWSNRRSSWSDSLKMKVEYRKRKYNFRKIDPQMSKIFSQWGRSNIYIVEKYKTQHNLNDINQKIECNPHTSYRLWICS